ncbi:TlpA family protein disulfide reductase [Bradyrhizobium sp. RDT10]
MNDFRGKVVLLNIWATWCVPCRKEMPTLDRLQAALGEMTSRWSRCRSIAAWMRCTSFRRDRNPKACEVFRQFGQSDAPTGRGGPSHDPVDRPRGTRDCAAHWAR